MLTSYTYNSIQEKMDHHEAAKRFGKRLRELREEEGIAQSALAESLSVSQTTIHYWEDNAWASEDKLVLPSFQNIMKLCTYFKCEPDYILGNIDYRTHDNKWICEKTGLSESAVDFLLSEIGSLYADILSELLTSKHTSEFLETFEQLAHAIDEPYPDLWNIEHSDGRRTYIQDAKELQHSGVKINQDILRRVLASKLENLLLMIGEGIEWKYWTGSPSNLQETSKEEHYKTPAGIPSIVTEKEKKQVDFLNS